MSEDLIAEDRSDSWKNSILSIVTYCPVYSGRIQIQILFPFVVVVNGTSRINLLVLPGAQLLICLDMLSIQ